MVKNSPANAGDTSSIPGQGIKILYATWYGQIKKKKKRIQLPMQGTEIQSLVWEDSTCSGATKLICCNYEVCALEPTSHSY